MKLIEYTTLPELEAKALEVGKELFETRTSWSYEIFENKRCTELHIFKK